MGTLSEAIEREDWELAALKLLVAATELIDTLGPEAMEDLLDLLDEPAPRAGTHRPKRGGRHGRHR